MDLKLQRGLINIISLGLIAAMTIFMLGAAILNKINTDKLEQTLAEVQADLANSTTNVTPSVIPVETSSYLFADLMTDSGAGILRLGTFTTTGYVIDQRLCPSCPAGAECIECEPDAVMVSATMTSTDLLPFETLTPDFQEAGIEYEMTITINNPAGPIILDDFAIGDTTALWQTYTNEDNSYSIQFPAGWSASEALGVDNVQLNPPGNGEVESVELGPQIFIKVNDTIYEDSTFVSGKVDVVINSLPAVQQVESGLLSNKTTYFQTGNGYISIHWAEILEADYPEYEQILSTFEFI